MNKKETKFWIKATTECVAFIDYEKVCNIMNLLGGYFIKEFDDKEEQIDDIKSMVLDLVNRCTENAFKSKGKYTISCGGFEVFVDYPDKYISVKFVPIDWDYYEED